MTTLNTPHRRTFLRSVEFCPYSRSCAQSSDCSFKETEQVAVKRSWRVGQMVAGLATGLLGAACLTVGVALSLTLFLVPVGIPLAILGTAFLMSGVETS